MEKSTNKTVFDFSGINYYMKIHDFLSADKNKIYNYINSENRMKNEKNKYVGGYLTRKVLVLFDGYGNKTEYSRIMLGIQENF